MNASELSELGPFTELTPERLSRDVTHYERMAAELNSLKTPREATLRRLYQTLATNRKGLLEALRDGRPELWTDYTGADTDRDRV